MLLVIDVGNTNTVLGIFRGERLIHDWRLQTDHRRTADEWGILIRHVFDHADLLVRQVEGVIISCVVPPLLRSLLMMSERYLGRRPMVVGPGIKTAMPIHYENPREVGADRIVNAVAAYTRYERGLIICDFGTATTVDVVTPKGGYLGGAIAPGISISAEALFHRASKLPRVEFARPARVVGRNTIESMQAGLLFGYVGLVTELINRMKAEIDFEPLVLGTGGLATIIAAETEAIDVVDLNLTLDGLRILWERNRPSTTSTPDD